MNLILVICHCKRSASEIRSFDLNRQQGKSFFDNCVDHTLVVCDSVVNDLIQIIIVFDVYLIKVVSIFIRSDFLNGRERADYFGIHRCQNQGIGRRTEIEKAKEAYLEYCE